MMDTIEQVKAGFMKAKDEFIRTFAAIPDDRINWSPSPSSRTPTQQVAHVAWSVKSINGMLDGHPFQADSTDGADRFFREWERQFSTREDVLALLDRNCADYVAWLDGLVPGRLEAMVEAPFKLGVVPIGVGIVFPATQIQWHTAQLAYMQTIYGDHGWRL
jgi:hypothetical protein